MELTVLGCSGSYGAPAGGACSGYLAARRRHHDLDGLRQRDVPAPAGARRPRRPHRGRHHPRAPRPLRRHLRPARPAPVRPRAVRASRCSRRRAPRSGSAVWSRAGATRSTGTRSATATRPGSARSTCGSPAPTTRRRLRGRGGRRRPAARLHGRHRPGVERRRVRRRAPTSCSRRRRTSHDNIPVADPPLGPRRPARGRARGEGPAADPHAHLAPGRPGGLGRGRIRGVRRAGHARRARTSSPRSDPPHARRRKRPMGIRNDGREPDELRPIAFTRDYTELAMGSVLVEMGRTRVLCTASVEDRVPPWLRGKGKGWVTAEYSMLPGLDARAGRPRGGQGQAERPHPGDPAPHRPLAARGDRPGRARRGADHRRLRRAAGRRRHAHRVDLRRLPRAARRVLAPRRRRSRSPRTRSPTCAPRSRSASSTRCRASTSTTPRTRRAEVDMNVVHDRRRASSSRCRARPRAPRSAAASSTRCSSSPSSGSTRSSSCSAR